MDGITTLLPVLLRDNDSSSLIRAAESVLSQDAGVPHELLIIDDGSSPPLALRPELRTLLQRANVLTLEANHGVAYALNAGLTQARYDWIARVDADDLWRPGKLKTQLAALARNPDLTLIGTGMRLVHTGDPARDRDERRSGDWGQTLELTTRIGCPFPHGSILARKDVFELLGGYPHVHGYEDFALWVKWMRFFPVAITDEILLEYTISPGQISSRFREHQEEAAARLQHGFRELGDVAAIPLAIQQIASRLGQPLIETGTILARAWMYADAIAASDELYSAARTVFPDREVQRFEHSTDLAVNCIFILARPSDPAPGLPARVTLTASDLQKLGK